MPAETAANLFLLEDLEDGSRTSELAESDLGALQAVADWIKTFVATPHKDLGRAWTRLSLRARVLGAQDTLARS